MYNFFSIKPSYAKLFLFHCCLSSLILVKILSLHQKLFSKLLDLIKSEPFLLINFESFSLAFELLFTATKLKQFSDFKLGISILVQGETGELLNAD